MKRRVSGSRVLYTQYMTSSQKSLSLLIGIVILFFLLRTINLTILPIFNDESTYIRFGLHQLNEPDHKPYSLLIGKEPLLPYLYALFGTGFGNLLVGARLVTIFFGLLTLTGLYLYTKTFIGEGAAFFTSLFYCLVPYTVFFDRLAIMDSAVSTVAVWSLYFTQLLLKKSLWWYALGLGAVMGIGMWVKTSDLFFLFLPLISYGIHFSKDDEVYTKAKMLVSALFLALFIFVPLFSNPFYTVHMQLLQQYTYPIYSVFLFPFSVWWNNFVSVVEWLFFYLTPPLFFLAIGSIVLITKQKKFSLVMLWFYLPLLYEILYAKLFTSRHLLLVLVPLLIAAGYGFFLLLKKKKTFGIILGVCIVIWCLYDTEVLLTSPLKYPYVFADRAQVDATQYVHGFSSGYGVDEAVAYLQQQATVQPIIVLIRNDFGNPEDAMVAYLDYKPNIRVVPMNDPATDVPLVFQKVGTSVPVYFVARGGYNAGLEKYFASEKIFAKPNDKEFVGVARLQPVK